jgi:hypothetical protein
MSKINFIPCVLWVKRGVAREIPNKIELTKDDLKRLIQESKQNLISDEEFVLIYIYFNIYFILFLTINLIIVLFVIII